MKLSARNQLRGKVVEIKEGIVTAKVALEVMDGKRVTSTISMDALNDLGIEVGSEAVAIIKASNVMIALDVPSKLSARNQLKGKVVDIKEGLVTAKVALDIGGGQKMTSTISMDALKDLGVKAGMEVIAIAKASNVMIAID